MLPAKNPEDEKKFLMKEWMDAYGLLQKGVAFFMSPSDRFYAILKGRFTPAVTYFGVSHPTQTYYLASNSKYIKFFVDDHKNHVKVTAILFRSTDECLTTKEVERISSRHLISIEDIVDFLVDVRCKWQSQRDPNIGSKWLRASGGLIRQSDNKFVSNSRLRKDGNWYTYDEGDEVHVISHFDII